MQVLGVDDLAALATSFNEMAASLQAKLRELEELSSLQRQFVSDVSHELRTPLSTIKMAADLLFESRQALDADRGPVRRAAGQPARAVRVAADRLARDQQVRRRGGHARRGPGRYLRPRAPFGRRRAAAGRAARRPDRVPAARDRASPRWTGAGWNGSCVTCWSTPSSTARARTSSSPAGSTPPRSRSRSGTTASGLPPGEERRVFERFWRADPARARTTGGTGLGLAISLEDARLHGGWLQAWGERGKGSVFRLTLPRAAGRSWRVPRCRWARPRPRWARLRPREPYPAGDADEVVSRG